MKMFHHFSSIIVMGFRKSMWVFFLLLFELGEYILELYDGVATGVGVRDFFPWRVCCRLHCFLFVFLLSSRLRLSLFAVLMAALASLLLASSSSLLSSSLLCGSRRRRFCCCCVLRHRLLWMEKKDFFSAVVVYDLRTQYLLRTRTSMFLV